MLIVTEKMMLAAVHQMKARIPSLMISKDSNV